MTYLILFAITALGAYLRYVNLSPFKFYPDAYQNLIVAVNLSNYRSVFGFLGEGGIFYPHFLMWTRPVYAMLINLFNIFLEDPVISARAVAFIAGLISIAVSFFVYRKFFKSNAAGLISSFLLATSFNHTVWGGFIYTETTGILFMLLTLLILFSTNEKANTWADWKDLLTGMVFTGAVFSRYEYLILLIPISFYVLQTAQKPYIKILNICASLFFFSSLILSIFYPVGYLAGLVALQLQTFVFLASVSILFFVLVIFAKKYYKQLSYAALIIVWATALLLFTPLTQLTSVRDFFSSDVLIGLTFLSGITLLLLNKKRRNIAFFVIIAVFLMFPFYYRVNNQMQRYVTHTLPFLLIPATYAVLQLKLIFSYRKTVFVGFSIFFFLLFWQISYTYGGIKKWNNGDWFKESYEEKSAKIISQNLKRDENPIILTAMPEPYYYFTGLSTQSILANDKPPFINFPENTGNRTVIIIDDMGMSDIFPNFQNFITKYLQDKKTGQYWVGQNYHYSIKTIQENKPVAVYTINADELISVIHAHQAL